MARQPPRHVDVSGGMGAQVGDGNNQDNTFNVGTYVEKAYLVPPL